MPFRPKPSRRHYTQVVLTTAFFTLVTWRFFEWRGLVSFIPLWLLFETQFRLRVRASMACDTCGFDPYLFMIDTNLAKREIERHWRQKFSEKGIPYPNDHAQQR